MSSSDQAKSKLLDSMRMSKQGSASTPAKSTPAPAKKAKPASKPASAAAKTKSTTKAKSTKPAAPKKPITDNFQAAQRVWPD